MSLLIQMPTTQPTISINKYSTGVCPFCDSTKEVKYEKFDTETGNIIVSFLDIWNFKQMVNTTPKGMNVFKVVECYCPQCFVAFSISKSLV